MSNEQNLKSLVWIGCAREDLKDFPDDVRQDIGFALYEVQLGRKPEAAKPLRGFGGAAVLEIIENFVGNTYRAVYTVKFHDVIYVLHCFQKKSKHGIKTPQQDIELIKQRLKVAEEDYKEHWDKS